MRLKSLVPILFCATCVAHGQDAFQGGGKPLTMKATALTADFHAVQIKMSGAGGGGLMDMIMSPMMMMMGALGSMGGEGSDMPPTGFLTAIDLSWTTGETQTLFNQNYLVVYKLDMDFAAMSKMKPDNRDLSSMDMRLSYLRTDGIQSFSPRPDITPEMYMKMLKAPPPPPAEKPKPTKPAKA